MLVEDEAPLAELYRQILEGLGHEVTTRTSSIEALEAFRARPGGFDLVVTDMTMPNMPGLDLSREILRIRPGFPILVCTGFSESLTPAKALELGLKGVLMKPISSQELAQAIREALPGLDQGTVPSETAILVIDDEEPVREMLRQLLEREGYRVFTSPDGKQALRVQEKVPVNLVITDIFMPEVDGLETIRKMRERFAQVKLIAISGGPRAFSGGDFSGIAGSLGADRVFSKPVDLQELLYAVRELVGSAHPGHTSARTRSAA